jgi:hypothetical protein
VARNTIVDGDIHALMTEIVSHRQAFDAPAIAQAVTHKIHAPQLIDVSRRL